MSVLRRINQTIGDLLFGKWNEVKEGDAEIFNLIDKAEILLRSNPKDGIRYLTEAEKEYNKRGYNFKINCRINEVVSGYINRYLPKIIKPISSPSIVM